MNFNKINECKANVSLFDFNSYIYEVHKEACINF
jgi:hypothetical protein